MKVLVSATNDPSDIVGRMTKCTNYFQFALLGLVAAAAAAPSGILAGGYLGGAAIAAPAIAAPALIRAVPAADTVPAGLAGLQVLRVRIFNQGN